MDPAAAPLPRLIVAVDGPGSSGKSSVGAAAAARLGYRFFDTGLLYRAVTWLAIRQEIADVDVTRLVALVDEVGLEADEQGRLSWVVVDGQRVEGELHGPAVDARVSAIAGIAEVRAALVGRQRSVAAEGGIVVAGRDIGTVILPDADVKIYLDASVEERAERRAGERNLGQGDPARAELLSSLRRRDAQDAGREVAPLRAAANALVFRTDGNTLEMTVALVETAIREAVIRRGQADAAGRTSARAAEPADSAPLPPSPHAGSVAAAPRSAGAPTDPGRRKRLPLPVTPVEGHLTLLIRFCSAIARLLARAVTRVRIEGDLGAIPRTGPVIIIANHASSMDPMVVGGFIAPRIGRRFNWLGKREVFDMPVLGFVARRGGIHAVERTAVDIEAFRTAQRILDAGHILAVFPEGTRSRTGALQEVKDGLAVLAQRSGAPVVPIAIVDADLVWPPGRKLPRIGGRIIVRVGAPITLAAAPSARGAARRDAKGTATRRMMGAIAAMLPPRQRGAYAETVAAPGASRGSPATGAEPRLPRDDGGSRPSS